MNILNEIKVYENQHMFNIVEEVREFATPKLKELLENKYSNTIIYGYK